MTRLLPLFFFLAVAAAPAALGDPLADGIKAVSSYDYGTDRTAILAFDTFIRSQPGDRARVEGALLPLLTQDGVSTAAKDYVCRWLGVIGSDASVPVLQKLTADPKLSHLAVYALLDLHTPPAKAALLDGLETAPAPLHPAIIGALGRAEVVGAVPVLAKAASSADTTEAAAALDALGAMGKTAAIEALRSAPVAASLEPTRRWALLHAANGAAKEGAAGQDAAQLVFASLLRPGTAAPLRNAAARGRILSDPATAFSVILPLLKDDDARVRLAAVRLSPLLSPDDLQALAPALPGLDPATQTALVNNLVEKPSAGVEPILQTALASAQTEVRLAAVAGYGAANLPGSASILLPLLTRGGDEAALAAASLKKLSQPDTGAQLKAAAAGAAGMVKATLLSVLAARQDRSAFDLFAASTGDVDSVVATAAFQGIEAVARRGDLDRIVGLLPQAKTNAEHKSLNATLLRCARVAADKDRAADFLIDALHGAAPETRGILLAAIATVPSPKAAACLQNQLAAPSVEERKEIIRAVTLARTPDADKLLLDAASHGAEPSEKILALRGYLDSIQAQDISPPQRVMAYRIAWPLAVRPEEKQAILDALKHLSGTDGKKAFDELSAQMPKSA